MGKSLALFFVGSGSLVKLGEHGKLFRSQVELLKLLDELLLSVALFCLQQNAVRWSVTKLNK